MRSDAVAIFAFAEVFDAGTSVEPRCREPHCVTALAASIAGAIVATRTQRCTSSGRAVGRNRNKWRATSPTAVKFRRIGKCVPGPPRQPHDGRSQIIQATAEILRDRGVPNIRFRRRPVVGLQRPRNRRAGDLPADVRNLCVVTFIGPSTLSREPHPRQST